MHIESLESRELLSVNLAVDIPLYAQTDNPAILTFDVESSKPEKSCNIYLAADTTGENNTLEFASIALLDSNGKSIGFTAYENDATRIFGAFTVTAGTYTAYVYAEDETAGNFQLDISGDNYDSKLEVLVEATLYQEKHYSSLFESNKAAYADPTNEKYLGEEYQAALNKKSGEEGNLWDLYKSIVDINRNEMIDEVDLSKARSYAKLGNAGLKGEVNVWAQDRTPPTIAFTHDYSEGSDKLVISVTDVSGVKTDSVKYSINGIEGQAEFDKTTGKFVLDSKDIETCLITVSATDSRGNTAEEISYVWLAWDAPIDIVAATPAILGGDPVAVPAISTIYEGYSLREIAGLEGSGTIYADSNKTIAIGTLAYGTGGDAGTLFFTPDENYFKDLESGAIAPCVFDVTIAFGEVTYGTTLTFYVQKPVPVADLPSLLKKTDASVDGAAEEGGKGEISASDIAGKWTSDAIWFLRDLDFESIDNGSVETKYADAMDYLQYISTTTDGAVRFDATDKFFTALGHEETLTITYTYKLFDVAGLSTDTGYLVFTVSGRNQASEMTIKHTEFEIDSNDPDKAEPSGKFGAIDVFDPDTIDRDGYTFTHGNLAINGKPESSADLLSVVYEDGVPVSFTVNTGELPQEATSVLTFDIIVTSKSGDTVSQTITVDYTPAAAPVVGDVEWELNQDGGPALELEEGYASYAFVLDDDSIPAGMEGVGELFSMSKNVLTFTPDDRFKPLKADDKVSLTLQYTVTDKRGLTGTGLVYVTITGTNDGPVFVYDGEDLEDILAIKADAGATTAIDLAKYFNDPDGDKLEVTEINGTSFSGGVAMVTDCGNFVFDYVAQTLFFTPDSKFDSLTDGEPYEGENLTFKLTVSDGEKFTDGEIPLTIFGGNTAPVVEDPMVEGSFGEKLDIDIMAAVSDRDGDLPSLDSVMLVSVDDEIYSEGWQDDEIILPSGTVITLVGGTLTIDSTARGILPYDEVETLVFGVTVTDGKDIGTGTITVTLTGTNKAPVVLEKTFANADKDELIIEIDEIVDDVNVGDTHSFVYVAILDENGVAIEDEGEPIVLNEDTRTATLESGTVITVDFNNGTLTFSEKLAPEAEETLKLQVTVTDNNGAQDTGTITVIRYAASVAVPVLTKPVITVEFSETDDTDAATEENFDLTGNIEGDSDEYGITWLGLSKAEHDPDGDDATESIVVTNEWQDLLAGFCTLNQDTGLVEFDAPADYFASLKDGETLVLTYGYLVKDLERGTFAEGEIIVTITGVATAPTTPGGTIELGSVTENKGEITLKIKVDDDILVHWSNPEGANLATDFIITGAAIGTVGDELLDKINGLLMATNLTEEGGIVEISSVGNEELSAALQELGAGQSVTVTVGYKVDGNDDTFTFVIEGANDAPVVEAPVTEFVLATNSSAATPTTKPFTKVIDPDSNHEGIFSYFIDGVTLDGEAFENPGFTINGEGGITIARNIINKPEFVQGVYVLTVAIYDLQGGKTTKEITFTAKELAVPELNTDDEGVTVSLDQEILGTGTIEFGTIEIKLSDYISISDGTACTFKSPKFLETNWEGNTDGICNIQKNEVFRFTPNGRFDSLPEGTELTFTFQFVAARSDYAGVNETFEFTITLKKNTSPQLKNVKKPVPNVVINNVPAKPREIDILGKWMDAEDDPLSFEFTAAMADGNAEGDENALEPDELDALRKLLTGEPGGALYWDPDNDGVLLFDMNDELWKNLGAGQSVVITVDYTVSDSNGDANTGSFTVTVNGRNDKPVMENDSINVLLTELIKNDDDGPAEDEVVKLATLSASDIDWNDTDEIGFVFTKIKINNTVLLDLETDNPGFEIDADGNVTIDADKIEGLETGSYTFWLQAVDGRGGVSATKSFKINVGSKPVKKADAPGELAAVTENAGKITSKTAPDENEIGGFLASRWTDVADLKVIESKIVSVVDSSAKPIKQNMISLPTFESIEKYLLAEEPTYKLSYTKNSDTLLFKVTDSDSPLRALGLNQSVTVTIAYTVASNVGEAITDYVTIVINGGNDAPSFSLKGEVDDKGNYTLIRGAGDEIKLTNLVAKASYKDVDDNSKNKYTLSATNYPQKWLTYNPDTGTIKIKDGAEASDYSFTLWLTDSDDGITTKKVKVTIFVPEYGPHKFTVTENDGGVSTNINVKTLANKWLVNVGDIDNFEFFKIEDTGNDPITPGLFKQIEDILKSLNLTKIENKIPIPFDKDSPEAEVFRKLGANQTVTLTISCDVATGVEDETVKGYVTLVINGTNDTKVEIAAEGDDEIPLPVVIDSDSGQYVLSIPASTTTVTLNFTLLNLIDDNRDDVEYRDVLVTAAGIFGVDVIDDTVEITIPDGEDLTEGKTLVFQVRTRVDGQNVSINNVTLLIKLDSDSPGP